MWMVKILVALSTVNEEYKIADELQFYAPEDIAYQDQMGFWEGVCWQRSKLQMRQSKTAKPKS